MNNYKNEMTLFIGSMSYITPLFEEFVLKNDQHTFPANWEGHGDELNGMVQGGQDYH